MTICRLLALAVSFALAACVVNPRPEPSLDPDRVSSSAVGSADQALVSGAPGAASGAGTIRVEARAGAGSWETTSDEAGSFALVLDGVSPGDPLAVVFSSPDLRQSPEVALMLTERPFSIPRVDAVTPPGALGLITVRGQALDGGARVVLSNLTRSAATEGPLSADGSFVVDVVAMGGDRLEVYVIDRAAGRASPTDERTVPVAPPPGLEICTGGIDEDGDGFTDCADPDCASFCRCPTSETFCAGTCVDTMFDAAHCGGCDIPCERGLPNCVRGTCSR